MSHDATKVLLETTGSSDRELTCENGDPATFVAGLAVRRASTGLLSLASGSLIGVSVGRDLSNTKQTSVCRVGNWVPIRLTDINGDPEDPDYSYAVVGQPVEVSATTGKAIDDDVSTGAFYLSGPLDGIDPITGNSVKVAYIDMAGGL